MSSDDQQQGVKRNEFYGMIAVVIQLIFLVFVTLQFEKGSDVSLAMGIFIAFAIQGVAIFCCFRAAQGSLSDKLSSAQGEKLVLPKASNVSSDNPMIE